MCVLVFLLLVSLLQELFYLYVSGSFLGWFISMGKVLLQVTLIWLFFSLVYHLAARLLGGEGRFSDILGLMAYASFPVTLLTLFVSCFRYCPVLFSA